MAKDRDGWSLTRWIRGVAGKTEARPPVKASAGESARPRQRAGHEQRRFPRVRVMSSLHGYGVELDRNVTILEVSRGGFSLESPSEFAVGVEQTFLFTTNDGDETLVRCQCRHSHAKAAMGGTQTYVAGFEFLPQPEENLRIIVETIDRLMKSLSDTGGT
jgi:hypothetical protein